MMKGKIKYVALLLAAIFITIGISVILLQTPTNRYSYDDIPRRYITGEITSISEQDEYIELLLDNGEPASVTMTVNGKVKIYEIVDENVKMVDFSKLKTGQTIQCDIRLSVTLEKINSFHDCRQIFILPDSQTNDWDESA